MDATGPPPLERAVGKLYCDVRGELATGDLLCFRNKDLDGRLIQWVTRSEYSHAGLVFVWDGRVFVLEAVTAGVRLVLMSRRVKAYNGGIDYFRILGVTEEQRRGAIGFALEQLGDVYNHRGLLRFLWFLMSGNKERIRERNGWFCSEIVAEAYRRQKAPFVPRTKTAYISPADLAKSDRVEFAFRVKKG